MKQRLLIITNFIMLVILVGLIFHYHYHERLITKVTNYTYQQNRHYKVRTGLFDVYSKKADIVMLGNSITEAADWNELLGRNDVLNRGISGDVTSGFLARMDYVYKSGPKICFVMGGINDIIRNVKTTQIIVNLEKISEQLREKDITPVIQSVLYINDIHSDYREVNRKVDDVNRHMKNYCMENAIEFLDLNKVLSKNGKLLDEYTYDGLHLNGKAYVQWKNAMLPVLKKYGLIYINK